MTCTVELSAIDADCAFYQVSVKGSPERRANEMRLTLVKR